jgi:hypothetical protein
VSLQGNDAYHIRALCAPGNFLLKGTYLLQIKSDKVFAPEVLASWLARFLAQVKLEVTKQFEPLK